MKYRYVGDGMGVPGLPAEISDEEAAALGVTPILNEAVQNGSYVEILTPAPKGKPEQKKKGELNNG